MAGIMGETVGEGGEGRKSSLSTDPSPMSGGVLLGVAAGGALGAVLRVLVGVGAVALLQGSFPLGTLTANLAGSLALGFLDARLSPDPRSLVRAFAIPGFCGGFTTFSALGLETVFLVEAGRSGAAVGYLVLSTVACVVGVVAGGHLGRRRPGGSPPAAPVRPTVDRHTPRRFSSLVLALALAWAAPQGVQALQEPPGEVVPGTVAGTVVEADTGTPVADALVILDGAGRGGRTGLDGGFSINGVPPGDYILRVRRLGYGDGALPVRVRSGERLQQTVILALDPLALEGITVTGEARGGLQGLVVDEVTRRPLPATLLRIEPRAAALTDSTGVFSFRELPPGGGLLLIEQFGYETLYVPVPSDRSRILEIALRPQPMGVDGLTVEVMQGNVAAMSRRIGNRRNAVAVPVRSWDQEALVGARSRDMRNFFESETPVIFVPCPRRSVAEDCVLGRGGRPAGMSVCIDEMPAPGGMLQLGSYRPEELYLVEVYSRGSLVMAYTRAFMERLARRRRALTPLEYLGC